MNPKNKKLQAILSVLAALAKVANFIVAGLNITRFARENPQILTDIGKLWTYLSHLFRS
jgi:hypothetical protein